MISMRVKAALAVLVLASLPLAASWAKPADSPDDTAAINKLVADFSAAFNNHDGHAVAMFFTDNGDLINGGGVATTGPAAIEQRLTPLFAGRLSMIHRDVTLRTIRFLRPDVAAVDSDFVTPAAGSNPAGKGFYDWVVTKQNGRWLIAAWHEANLPAPPPPAAH